MVEKSAKQPYAVVERELTEPIQHFELAAEIENKQQANKHQILLNISELKNDIKHLKLMIDKFRFLLNNQA